MLDTGGRIAVISSLDILLRGNTSGLDSAIDRSTKKVGKFKDSIGSNLAQANGAFGRLFSTIPGLGGLAGIGKNLMGVFSGAFGLVRKAAASLASGIGRALGNIPGLGGIGRALGSVGGSLGGLGSVLAGVGAGFAALAAAAALAGAALVGFGLSRMTAIGDIARQARELGITAEALVGMQHAADQSGLSAESLTEGLRHLQRGLSEAAGGGGHVANAAHDAAGGMQALAGAAGHAGASAGGAGKAFAQLGLSAQQLSGLSVDEQMGKLADAFTSVKNPADRTRLAMELFGRGGAEMGELLAGGSKGLAAMREEAKALGLTFSGAQAEAVENANKAWKRMRDSLTGVGNTMAIAIAPAVTAVTGLIQRLFVSINAGIQAALPYVTAIWDTGKAFFSMLWDMGKAAVEAVGAAFSALGLTLGDWGITWEGIKKAFLEGLWTMQFQFGHWRDYLSLGWDQLVYGFSRFTTAIVYAFTDQLPAVFVAFGQFAGTFFENLWANIKDNFSTLWDYLASGGTKGGDFVWHGLTDGWDKAMKTLREKSSAPLTDFEKGLAEKIKGETDKLSEGLAKYIADKWAEFTKGPEADKPLAKAAASVTAESRKPVAAEMGTEKAFEIIAGQQGDKMYAVANDQLKEMRAHNKKLDKLLNDLQRAPVIGRARI